MQNAPIFHIFSVKDSNRFRYTTALIFEQMLGIKCEIVPFSFDEISKIIGLNHTPFLFFITKNEFEIVENFIKDNTKNFDENKKLPIVFLKTELLFQTNINHNIDVNYFHENGERHYLFYKKNKHSEKTLLNFDVFSAIFYLVSRYEEYNTAASRDKHGRFSAENSISFRYNFSQKPVVDIWVKELQIALENLYPNLEFKPKKYRFQPTFDIDMAWCYKHKNWQQIVGRIANDALTLNFSSLRKRWQSVFGNDSDDPFFTYDFIASVHQKQNILPVIYFFLLGKYSNYDKNVNTENPDFQKLIQVLSKNHAIGIHPSYRSNESEAILKNEIDVLHKITNKTVEKSRQHFLKLDLPTTYCRLLSQNILEDWTMGYAEYLGFRAGISHPFYWFDLERNEATNLLIVPFCIMDVTMRVYLKLSPEDAILAAKKIINSVQSVDGQLVTLWHNSSLSEHEEWENWREVYDKIVALSSTIEKPLPKISE